MVAVLPTTLPGGFITNRPRKAVIRLSDQRNAYMHCDMGILQGDDDTSTGANERAHRINLAQDTVCACPLVCSCACARKKKRRGGGSAPRSREFQKIEYPGENGV